VIIDLLETASVVFNWVFISSNSKCESSLCMMTIDTNVCNIDFTTTGTLSVVGLQLSNETSGFSAMTFTANSMTVNGAFYFPSMLYADAVPVIMEAAFDTLDSVQN